MTTAKMRYDYQRPISGQNRTLIESSLMQLMVTIGVGNLIFVHD